MQKTEFYTRAQTISSIFHEFLERSGIGINITPDHICYKCESNESYEKTKSLFDPGNILNESVISQRNIAVIKLDLHISTGYGNISTLELSDQKPDNSQSEGFHHIEFMLDNIDKGFVERKLQPLGLELRKKFRPHHTTYDVEYKGFVFRITNEPLEQKVLIEKSSV